jgi:heme/copper-type cytochrome/quinol oxidase subunit 4
MISWGPLTSFIIVLIVLAPGIIAVVASFLGIMHLLKKAEDKAKDAPSALIFILTVVILGGLSYIIMVIGALS